MILVVFGADFIFATGIMYVSKIAGNGEQALAGGVFNMVTREHFNRLLLACSILKPNSHTSEVGTAIGLAIVRRLPARK